MVINLVMRFRFSTMSFPVFFLNQFFCETLKGLLYKLCTALSGIKFNMT